MILYAPIAFDYGAVSGETVAIAASVFAVLQCVKKFTNLTFLQGRWAIAANVVLNVLGVVAVTPPNQLLSTPTLVNLITAVFLASGFHGITTTLIPATGGAGDPDNSSKTELPAAQNKAIDKDVTPK